jgi:cellobiose phosphorylase
MMFLVYKHFTEKIGKGKHGLQRIADCDWNDMVITGFVPRDQEEIVRNYGESVLNSAMAVYVLSIFSEMLDFIGEKTTIKSIMDYISELRKATLEQWNGKWFRRAWLSEDLGWVGDDILWLEPQPWTIIGEIIKKEEIHEFVNTLDEMVRKPSQIGAMLHNKPISNFYNPPGMGTNAGIWP